MCFCHSWLGNRHASASVSRGCLWGPAQFKVTLDKKAILTAIDCVYEYDAWTLVENANLMNVIVFLFISDACSAFIYIHYIYGVQALSSATEDGYNVAHSQTRLQFAAITFN